MLQHCNCQDLNTYNTYQHAPPQCHCVIFLSSSPAVDRLIIVRHFYLLTKVKSPLVCLFHICRYVSHACRLRNNKGGGFCYLRLFLIQMLLTRFSACLGEVTALKAKVMGQMSPHSKCFILHKRL